MSIVKISAAFEKKLNTLETNFPTAYENVQFTPVTGTAYQRVRILPAQPDNPTIGDSYYREVGLFEVILFYPLDIGRNAAQVKAEAIKALFKRGLAMVEDGLTVVVDRTPSIASAVQLDDRYVVPITISYYAEVQS